ncbi:putative class III chitinase [Xylaria nigripes]|nr:putative class III chitinase [Xylaria nigripes]
MAPSMQTLASAASILAFAPSALAGFSTTGGDNLSVYWGQNSAGGADTQGRLKEYCDDNGINIINLSFMDGISTPTINFSSASNACTPIAGTNLATCPEMEEDIKYCQSQGKTIMLSLGGATYSEGGFPDSSSAEAAAQNVWDLFGSDTSKSNRPFGQSVLDGFDFDLESTTQNFAPFAQKLRDLMDADSSKVYYLSAAPQCVYPDAAMNDMLDGAISFDWINIQFYNNFCGVINFSNPNAWNFATWDDWAKNTSKNPNVRVFIGVPGSTTAGGGYVDAATLGNIISDTSKYSSFGGVMAWDMSQIYQNSGFLDSVVSSLGGLLGLIPVPTSSPTASPLPTTMMTSTRAAPTAIPTAAGPSNGAGLGQWAQCGGSGYVGSTTCASPFQCVQVSSWWSQCE